MRANRPQTGPDDVRATVARWPPYKLRILAYNGCLPIWWWFREQTILCLAGADLPIEDSFTENTIKEAVFNISQ